MKTRLLFFVAFAATLATHSQNLAKVQKVNGKEVYILSEPIRPYEVVMGKGNSLKWSSFLTGGLINESVSTKAASFVNHVKKEAEKESIDFDAIVYTNGKKVIAVKFTDAATPETDRIAEVQKMDGYPVYVMSEPLEKYTVEADKGPGIKWKSFLTVGLLNNSIEQDMDKYADRFRAKLKKGKIDALQYTSGKTAIGIKFN